MSPKKLLVTCGAIVVVASAAILAPAIASGVPLAPLIPVSDVEKHDDGPGDRGQGNAFGHDKPGKKDEGRGKHDDGPGKNGQGNAFGHDKGSDDFPGKNGRGHDD